jgi:GNAT superfamily N-acetyltransferase
MTKRITVVPDHITDELSRSFDYEFDGTTEFEPLEISPLDREASIGNEWGIGLIVGPSGSGKSTLLKEFGNEEHNTWDSNKAVCSHFIDAKDAEERLSSVGFNTIPAWMRPYHVLSNGEQFRADLARRIKDGAVIDEFTSVVDRNVARSCSVALKKYVDKKGIKNLVFATCHYDIIDWLEPDWVYDTVSQTVESRRYLRRPEIEVEVVPCSVEAWSMFSAHHYLSGDINKSSRCWLAIWNDQPVGFSSVIALPSGTIQNAWRGHRTVILPDFQGLGIGVRLSDAIGEIHVQEGKRYFSKTAHPRLGEYRENSPKWKATSKNGISRQDYNESESHRRKYSWDLLSKHKDRVCYSHEYIG